MLPQRTGFKVVMKPIAENRIALNQCPACGKPKEDWKRRKDWTCCCADCTDIFWKELVLYNGWNDLRKKVFERDNHKCVKCGADGKKKIKTPYGGYKTIELDADHIIPIALGGDEWDIDNVQTLCGVCHKKKTKKDICKIAIARRKDIHIQVGQKSFKEHTKK
jgi:5-methylcytosine-specific restriction endonuclease McrA